VGNGLTALRRLTATIGPMHESPKLRMAVIELWSPKHLDAIVAALDKATSSSLAWTCRSYTGVVVMMNRRGDLCFSRVRARDRMKRCLRGRGGTA
jgi:hypothetical protein